MTNFSVPLIDKVVNLDRLHDITPDQEAWFVHASGIVDMPNPTVCILFSGGGYEAETLIKQVRGNPEKPRVTFHLFEQDPKIIDACKKRLEPLVHTRENIEVQYHPISIHTDTFNILPQADIYIAKQGLHEINKLELESLIKQIQVRLKERGRFVIWETLNENPTNPEASRADFSKFIKEKDAIVETQGREYTFLSEKEHLDLLRESGFTFYSTINKWQRRWSTLSRYNSELEKDPKALDKLNHLVETWLQKPDLASDYDLQTSKFDHLVDTSFIINTAILLGIK